MSSGQVPKVQAQQSIVVVTGLMPGGATVAQEIPVPHAPGTPDSALIAHVLQAIRTNGGLMTEGPDNSVNFYPLLTLVSVNFSVKRVSLALGNLALH